MPALAFVVSAVEGVNGDFGITPVEAHAYGTHVIASGREQFTATPNLYLMPNGDANRCFLSSPLTFR